MKKTYAIPSIYGLEKNSPIPLVAALAGAAGMAVGYGVAKGLTNALTDDDYKAQKARKLMPLKEKKSA
jgi:hypothetical protein